MTQCQIMRNVLSINLSGNNIQNYMYYQTHYYDADVTDLYIHRPRIAIGTKTNQKFSDRAMYRAM